MKQRSLPTASRRARGLALSALVGWGAFVGGCGARDVGEFDLEGFAGAGGTGAGGFGGTGAGGFGGTGAGGFGGTGAGGFGGTGAGGFGGTGGFGGFAGSGAFGGSAGFAGSGGIAGSGALGGSAGVGGSAGSGGAPGGENCTNGIDDNGNGLVDCEDPACAPGFACAASVPAGWSGPVAFYAGNAPVDCLASGGYPNTLLDGGVGVSAPPATCSGCGCASAQGVVCPVAQISLHPNTTCSGQGGTLTLPANVCQAFVSLSEIRSVRWATATPAGGSCNPFGGQPGVLPPPVWNERARVCSAAQQGGGCGSGTCVPRPAAPFNPLACVARIGNHSCPAGYPFKETFNAGVNDTRDCTDCSCSAPTGATCSGSLDMGSDATCSADAVNLASVGQCAAVGPDSTPPVPPYLESRSARYNQGPATPATCAPSGGQVTGGVTPGPLVTVCCDA